MGSRPKRTRRAAKGKAKKRARKKSPKKKAKKKSPKKRAVRGKPNKSGSKRQGVEVMSEGATHDELEASTQRALDYGRRMSEAALAGLDEAEDREAAPDPSKAKLAKDLLDAASGGQDAEVERLLAAGADIEARSDEDVSGHRPLHGAASSGHSSTVELLLASGASVDAPTYVASRTSLHLAAQGGHAAIVKVLLEHGAAVDSRDKYKWTPLMKATRGKIGKDVYTDEGDFLDKYARLFAGVGDDHCEVAKLLLDAGASVNAKDDKGCTPLHHAASSGHKGLVNLLLARGASLQARDDSGQRPIDYAGPTTDTELLQLLSIKLN